MSSLVRIAVVLCHAMATAQVPRFREHLIAKFHDETVAGYGLHAQTLVTWGDRLLWWNLPDGHASVIRGRGTPFIEGGCLLDVDGDGQADLIVNEGGAQGGLVWFRAPAWSRHVIDTRVDAPDIVPAILFGRRGILLIHKRAQVRFYAIPSEPTARWPSQDVYSFYSPAQQGGLGLADVDGDGHPDILAGMYWIRSPGSFELPWRLFAINLWNETPRSALMRLTYRSLVGDAPELVAVQRAMYPARLAWFAKPADPRQLWNEHRIQISPDLDSPNSLDLADFDGDGRLDILVAENGGTGRLLVLRNEGGGRFTPVLVSQGRPVVFAQTLDLNHSGRPGILAIRADAIAWWENVR